MAHNERCAFRYVPTATSACATLFAASFWSLVRGMQEPTSSPSHRQAPLKERGISYRARVAPPIGTALQIQNSPKTVVHGVAYQTREHTSTHVPINPTDVLVAIVEEGYSMSSTTHP